MKYLSTALLGLVVAVNLYAAAPTGIEIRQGGLRTTNGVGIAGQYLTTDGTNFYWADVLAISTNPVPNYVVTNQETKAINIAGNLTNSGDTYLQGIVRLPGGGGSSLRNSGQTYSGAYTATSSIINLGWMQVDGAQTNTGVIQGASMRLSHVSTNRPMIMSSSGYVTNAFKHFKFETNVSPILSNLVVATTSGDVIELGVGDFFIGEANLRVPVGVTLRGQGYKTRIHSGAPLDTNGPVITISSSNIIEDFEIVQTLATSRYQAAIGFNSIAGNAPATNSIIRRVRAFNGESDAVFFKSDSWYTVYGEDCDFESKWDTYVQMFASGAGTTNYCIWKNSRFKSDISGATFSEALITRSATPIRLQGRLDLRECAVTATNGNISKALVIESDLSAMHVYGGSREAAGTNTVGIGDNFTLTGENSTACPFYFYNTDVQNTDLITGSFAKYSDTQVGSLAIVDGVTAGSTNLINALSQFIPAAGDKFLALDISATSLGWVPFSALGGGGTPVGVDGSVQYNKSSAFYGTNQLRVEDSAGLYLVASNTSGAGLLLKGNNTQLLIEAGGAGASFVGTTNASVLRLGTSNEVRWIIRGTATGLNGPGDLVSSGSLNLGEFPGASATFGHIANVNGQNVRAHVYSNVVYSIPGDTSVVTLYGTNQFWRLNITSNITFADSGLGSNIVYWIKATNNASTVTYPGTWRWLSGPSLTTAPSLQGGEYILRVQKFDDATNAWVEVQPSLILVAGPGQALTTNGNTVTINSGPFQTLAYTDVTNCIFNMALGYNASITLTNSVGFDQPINLRAGADFKIYVAQDNVGTRGWWFNTNYWQFNVFPYLPVETNATRISVLSGFVNPAGTKLIVMQATDFRP